MATGLHDMRQFVSEKAPPVAGAGPVHAPGEVDVSADGERPRCEITGGTLGRWIGMDAHRVERSTERGFEGRPDIGVDGRSGAISLGRGDACRAGRWPVGWTVPPMLEQSELVSARPGRSCGAPRTVHREDF